MERAFPDLQQLALAALRNAPPAELPLLCWPLACGPGVAERTRATAVEQGRLHVEVADLPWRRQLESMAPTYLRRLNDILQQAGAEKLAAIRFEIASSAAHASDEKRETRNEKPAS